MASLVSYLKTAAAAVQRPTHKGAQDERQRAARIRGPVGQRNATASPAIAIASPDEQGSHNVMNGVRITTAEAYLFDWFGKDSAVIPLGVFMTSLILASGLFSMQQKNRANQQYAMRSRVVAQGMFMYSICPGYVYV
jgi:hypothetical protein